MFLTENVTEAVAETVEAVSSKLSLGEAGVYGLLGYAVVFFGLVLLMLVIMALGKAFSAKEKQAAAAPVAAAPAAPAPAPAAPTSVSEAADDLMKLKELLDAGILTQEEFDAKKKQLLGL